MPSPPQQFFYAVHRGHQPGVYNSWPDCQKQTKGFPKAMFKKFKTKQEAEYFSKHGREEPLDSEPGQVLPVNEIDNIGNYTVVYTDGCARGNGKIGSYGGIGVWYGDDDSRNISEPLFGTTQTNNRAELTAVVKALEEALKEAKKMDRKVVIRTDSDYTIRSVTEYYLTWERNGYKTSSGQEVKNVDLIKAILELRKDINRQLGCDNGVVFEHIPGHSGVLGNEMADQLANEGAVKGRREFS